MSKTHSSRNIFLFITKTC